MIATVGAHSPSPVKQRKKRIVTAARREQNKIAQRAYRERQKEQKQASQCKDTSRKPRRLEPRCNLEATPGIESPSSVLPNESSASSSSSTDVGLSINQADVLAPSNAQPSYSEGDLSLISQISNPGQLSGSGSNTATFPSYDATLDAVYHRPADLHANTLEDAQTTVFSACLQNAICLGLNLFELVVCASSYMSPFFRPSTAAQTDPMALVASSARSSLPANLQPTLAQIMIPHHASIDLIPLPVFRDRVIMMSAAMPSLFDLWDLKLDIYVRNALMCWRARSGTTYQPWDMRSWEAEPWFLRKWAVATNGVGGCELAQSAPAESQTEAPLPLALKLS